MDQYLYILIPYLGYANLEFRAVLIEAYQGFDRDDMLIFHMILCCWTAFKAMIEMMSWEDSPMTCVDFDVCRNNSRNLFSQ